MSFRAIEKAICLWENNINGGFALFTLDCVSILSFLWEFLLSVPLQLKQSGRASGKIYGFDFCLETVVRLCASC